MTDEEKIQTVQEMLPDMNITSIDQIHDNGLFDDEPQKKKADAKFRIKYFAWTVPVFILSNLLFLELAIHGVLSDDIMYIYIFFLGPLLSDYISAYFCYKLHPKIGSVSEWAHGALTVGLGAPTVGVYGLSITALAIGIFLIAFRILIFFGAFAAAFIYFDIVGFVYFFVELIVVLYYFIVWLFKTVYKLIKQFTLFSLAKYKQHKDLKAIQSGNDDTQQ